VPSGTSLKRLDHDLAQAAYDLHVRVEACLHDVLSELDLSVALADALWHLDSAGEAMSRRALAQRLRCHPSNVTFLADRLEQGGLISRVRAADDRRANALTLTPPGIAARKRLLAAIAESAIFSELTIEEQRQLAGLIRRCVGFGSGD
jgi:MarR family transcriptional regulator, organic hydroperoxide resistance regulator